MLIDSFLKHLGAKGAGKTRGRREGGDNILHSNKFLNKNAIDLSNYKMRLHRKPFLYFYLYRSKSIPSRYLQEELSAKGLDQRS